MSNAVHKRASVSSCFLFFFPGIFAFFLSFHKPKEIKRGSTNYDDGTRNETMLFPTWKA